ncbi:cupin domain-containing protein [Hamadaea sp. NPDC050747]|uniref:cupin domain-containing protein n=1 Tax=Hamadaea sp. NPDC050747 TaxID=3155789 RepID=UPI0033C2A0D4
MTDVREIQLGPVGQRVVFENEHVRVWEITLAPGESQTWHRHENPYLVMALEGARNRIVPVDGGEPRRVAEEAGNVIFRPAGEVHMLTNEGDTTYRSRLVELLTTNQ